MTNCGLPDGFVVVAYCSHAGGSRLNHGDHTLKYFQRAAEVGIDVVIDTGNMADLCGQAGLKLIVNTVLCPEDYAEPMGRWRYGWPKPQAQPRPIVGDVEHLARLHEALGDHPAVIGYYLNEACTTCRETDRTAAWLRHNAPEKLPYLLNNNPSRQQTDLYPVISPAVWPFARDATPGRTRHGWVLSMLARGRHLAIVKNAMFWPAIVGRKREGGRPLTPDEMQYQIEKAEALDADGVVIWPWGTKYAEWGGNRTDGSPWHGQEPVEDIIPSTVGDRAVQAFAAAKERRQRWIEPVR